MADGDWVEVDKLCGKMTFQQQKSFLYAAYREQFIELIDAQEYQKAFTHLTKRLKVRLPDRPQRRRPCHC